MVTRAYRLIVIVFLTIASHDTLGEEIPSITPPIVLGFVGDGRLSWYRMQDTDGGSVRTVIRSTIDVEKPENVLMTACRVESQEGTVLNWWPRAAKAGFKHSWFCSVDVPSTPSLALRQPSPITTLYRVPLRDYQPLHPEKVPVEREHWDDEVIDLKFGRAKASHAKPSGSGYNTVGWSVPTDEAFAQLSRFSDSSSWSELYGKIGYDFVVVGTNRLLVFILAPDPVAFPFGSKAPYPKNLYLINYEFRAFRFDPSTPGAPRPTGIPVQERTEWRWQWHTVRALESDIAEPFQAVVNGDQSSLITHSGALYAVPSKSDGQKSKLRKVGLRDGQIVQILIRDDDHDGRTFAFTNRYWFEVKEPIEYHSFEMDSLNASDPMPVLLRCAQEVRNHLATKKRQQVRATVK